MERRGKDEVDRDFLCQLHLNLVKVKCKGGEEDGRSNSSFSTVLRMIHVVQISGTKSVSQIHPLVNRYHLLVVQQLYSKIQVAKMFKLKPQGSEETD